MRIFGLAIKTPDMRVSKSLLIAFIFSLSAMYVVAQECKVMLENIQTSYVGDCKNKLAHGNGTAHGIDTYTGSFKKGYPNGKGLYKWSTGEYYDGEWLMGKRDGSGTYHYTQDGKDAVQSGVWKSDKYLGPVPLPPTIKLNQNISDVKINRTGDGNQVVIKMMMAGSKNIAIYDVSLNANSGREFNSGSYMGFESVVFPFKCKITYTSPNSLHTTEYHCTLDFEIPEEGRWEVKLVNN
jgi:hypothetical protein